jgi:Fur family transcriptional regulator, stress-responsive regulator
VLFAVLRWISWLLRVLAGVSARLAAALVLCGPGATGLALAGERVRHGPQLDWRGSSSRFNFRIERLWIRGMVGVVPASSVDFVGLLRDAGLRVTASRVAVLCEVTEGKHVTADQVASGVRDRVGTISTQAVYDVLAALTRAGLVRSIEPAGSPARYETRVGDNHHHVVCRLCGAITDVDCVVGAPPCVSPSDANGFVIDEAEVTFWGVCPTCHKTSKSD